MRRAIEPTAREIEPNFGCDEATVMLLFLEGNLKLIERVGWLARRGREFRDEGLQSRTQRREDSFHHASGAARFVQVRERIPRLARCTIPSEARSLFTQ